MSRFQVEFTVPLIYTLFASFARIVTESKYYLLYFAHEHVTKIYW